MRDLVRWKDNSGFRGELKLFTVFWEVFRKEYEKTPYVVGCCLPYIKKRRFKTEKEAKEWAEKILKLYFKHLKVEAMK